MADRQRICLVTGAGHIGKAIINAFQQAGYVVLAADLVPCDIPGVEYFQLDQSSAESVTRLGAAIRARYPHLDVLVNNAALGGHLSSIHEKPLTELDALLAVNVRGPYLMAQMALQMMLDTSKKGVIINIASTAASRATPGASVYNLSKAALVSITRSITAEYAARGIRAVTISPGIMDIPNIQGIPDEMRQTLINKLPSKRAGLPSEVASLAVFLASDAAAYINGSEHLSGLAFKFCQFASYSIVTYE